MEKRTIKTAVTNFLYHNGCYLFLLRSTEKRVDPGRLNGIGGKVEANETFVDAAIRETSEETGYVIAPSDMRLSGVVQLAGGYEEDWLICFFTITVSTFTIPLGNKTSDGELLWIKKEDVLKTQYELVDDVRFCFAHIVAADSVFFMRAQLNENQRIVSHSLSTIPSSFNKK